MNKGTQGLQHRYMNKGQKACSSTGPKARHSTSVHGTARNTRGGERKVPSASATQERGHADEIPDGQIKVVEDSIR